ncbi:UDP-N-acetylmuramate dehydrogenase [Candidatus Viridilinea mediisalina]|uniref:UDP-N-acetylmuramate dehydrogenase n=1 Tax=Candidatus Viridilinea mediisalina TaxID=2024553 RepID=UPI0024831709|nr:UDP-N-acetylmuramate dehydrogenase [Candidatus Viridilinea mediisalina]
MSSVHPPDLPPIRTAEPMERHTSWRAGGVARYYSEPRSPEQAQALLAWVAATELPLLWVGRGTNLLVDDAGYPGLIASYRAQGWQLEHQGDYALLHVEAGAPMAGLARRVSSMGWAGLAWAEGLPGSVGGAIVGNAGCYGGDIASSLVQAQLLLDNQIVTWPVARFAFGYRSSVLKALEARSSALVLAATFRLQRGNAEVLKAHMAEIAAQRKQRTPAGSSCGSVFKNPPGDSAGRLIEAVGLKGYSIGTALVSPLHANYIINRGGARACDIQALIGLIQAEVARQFGVMLQLEVRIVP